MSDGHMLHYTIQTPNERVVVTGTGQAGQVAGRLIHGVGELGVTALRITKGVAGTKCSGFGCVEKDGEDNLARC